jgi:hypothetical protein
LLATLLTRLLTLPLLLALLLALSLLLTLSLLLATLLTGLLALLPLLLIALLSSGRTSVATRRVFIHPSAQRFEVVGELPCTIERVFATLISRASSVSFGGLQLVREFVEIAFHGSLTSSRRF